MPLAHTRSRRVPALLLASKRCDVRVALTFRAFFTPAPFVAKGSDLLHRW